MRMGKGKKQDGQREEIGWAKGKGKKVKNKKKVTRKKKKKKGMNKIIKLCRPMMYPRATKESNHLFHQHHRKIDYIIIIIMNR